MIKIVSLLKRRPDLTPEEFRTYYLEQHVPLFHRVLPADLAPVIKGYVVNHAARLSGSTGQAPFDAVTEFLFDDLDGVGRWKSWYASPGADPLRADELNFVDLNQCVVVVTEPHDLTPIHDTPGVGHENQS